MQRPWQNIMTLSYIAKLNLLTVSRLGLALLGGVLLWAAGCASGPQAPVTTPPQAKPAPVADAYVQAMQAALVRQGGAAARNDYRIGPNDVLEIKVYEQEKMNTTTRVGGDGTIRFPALGVLQVGGLNERALEAQLQDRLRGKYLVDPHVSVFVKEPHAREVAVIGEVKTPGLYPIYGEESLVDILSKAGGITEKAGDVAYVIRSASARSDRPSTGSLTAGQAATPTSLKIDLNGLLVRGEQQWNVPLEAGDCISVPQSGWVHVTGNGIEKPGTYQLRAQTNTLRQFLDEAGGVKFSADRKLLLMRKNPDGSDTVMPVNYKQIQKDARLDPPVQSGDTVIVNRAPVRAVLYAIGAGLAKIFNISLYYNFAASGK